MNEPIPMLLWCPYCDERHIDEGTEMAERPHSLHACQHCGATWRHTAVDTIGVRFLPGFKNERHGPPAPAAEPEPVDVPTPPFSVVAPTDRSRMLRRARQNRWRAKKRLHETSTASTRDVSPLSTQRESGKLEDGDGEEERASDGETSTATSTASTVSPVTHETPIDDEARAVAGELSLADIELVWRKFLVHYCAAPRRPLRDAWRAWTAQEAQYQRAGRDRARLASGSRRPVQSWSRDDFDIPKEMP